MVVTLRGRFMGGNLKDTKRKKLKSCKESSCLWGTIMLISSLILRGKGKGIVQTKDGRFFEGEFINE